jgi:parallel beta-helix repeat protein
MELGNGFSFKNSFAVGLILVFLVFSSLRFVPLCGGFSSASFLVVNSKGEYIHENSVSIQEAINAAENGSIILVPSGTYHEHVVINKTISLVGENVSTTIIDGSNNGTVVKITVNNVSISGFTIRNSGCTWNQNGIYVYGADNCEIKSNCLSNNCHNIHLNYSRNSRVVENIIDSECYGIRIMNSVNCTATGNSVSNCYGGIVLQNAANCTVKRNFIIQNGDGIRLYSPCTYNQISANTVRNNTYDGMIAIMPGNITFLGNIFFHNNFINNTHPFIYNFNSDTTWDDGYPSGGNYWGRYNDTDLYGGPYQNETGNDGIGDTSYAINAYDKDRYPLMYPWSLLPVHNINTGIGYNAIQGAIDASETLNSHVLWGDSGIYHENVNVHKSLKLVGENKEETIIDAEKKGIVLLVSADNVSVAGFTIRNSGLNYPPYGNDCGVFLDHSRMANISNILVTNNRIGIYLFYSQNNIIEDNIVSSNHVNGIWLYYSSNNVLAENRISNNSYNFGVFGDDFSDFNNTIDVSNTVEGKPIQYLIGVEDKIFDNSIDIGVLYLINCNNVTVRDLNLTKNGHGVFCYNVTDSRIENIVASNNNYGICLQFSFYNTIIDNYCPNNWVGICLQESRNNTVESNIAPNNEKGISLYKADNNNITRNTISNNLYGIRLFASSFNEVFHNNLVGNTNHVSLINSYLNVWDNGFEGNFWSNYTGSDVDRDGLGDTPQIIDDSNRDYHPLLGPFYNFSIYHEGKLYDVTLISNSTILKLVFETANHTIRLTVNGTNGTFGFCRICIPHALIEPEIAVIIDDGLTEVLYLNYTVRDDGFRRWICFAYQHSTHEILIIPEFWSTIFLSTLMVITLWYLFFRKLEMRLRLKHSMDVSDG